MKVWTGWVAALTAVSVIPLAAADNLVRNAAFSAGRSHWQEMRMTKEGFKAKYSFIHTASIGGKKRRYMLVKAHVKTEWTGGVTPHCIGIQPTLRKTIGKGNFLRISFYAKNIKKTPALYIGTYYRVKAQKVDLTKSWKKHELLMKVDFPTGKLDISAIPQYTKKFIKEFAITDLRVTVVDQSPPSVSFRYPSKTFSGDTKVFAFKTKVKNAYNLLDWTLHVYKGKKRIDRVNGKKKLPSTVKWKVPKGALKKAQTLRFRMTGQARFKKQWRTGVLTLARQINLKPTLTVTKTSVRPGIDKPEFSASTQWAAKMKSYRLTAVVGKKTHTLKKGNRFKRFRFAWDGKIEKKALPPKTGVTVYLRGKDVKGRDWKSNEVRLTIGASLPRVTLKSTPIGLNRAKLNITTKYADQMASWRLLLQPVKGEKAVVVQKGTKQKPAAAIVLNMVALQDQGVDIGKTYRVVLSGQSKNKRSWQSNRITIKTRRPAPPELSLQTSPDVFTPDGNGENDTFMVKPRLKLEKGNELARWEVTFYKINFDDKNQTDQTIKRDRQGHALIAVRTISGKGAPPAKITWDGLYDDQKKKVGSDGRFQARMSVVDVYGNKTVAKPASFRTGIFILKTKRGLMIDVSSIKFKTKSAALQKRYYDIVKKVYRVTQKYKGYKLFVEGHADHVGPANPNYMWSWKRARAVAKYIVQLGYPKKQVKSFGCGEAIPKTFNVEKKALNRRVLFFLIKNKQVEKRYKAYRKKFVFYREIDKKMKKPEKEKK